MEITMDQREAYSEVLEVLRHMEKKYIDKIPKKIIMFLYDNCRLDYEFTMTDTLENTKLNSKAIDLLSLINAHYWQKKTSKEDIIMNYGIEKQIDSKLEKENKFTKIEKSDEKIDDVKYSNLPVPVSVTLKGVKKVLVFIKDLIIKIFGD